jgi:TLD
LVWYINSNKIALLEQFMVGTTKFKSMGGNADGSCGLRINEDLTKGESSPATGFDNEPLHGKNKGSVFEIGLLEAYGFTRQIDGKSV